MFLAKDKLEDTDVSQYSENGFTIDGRSSLFHWPDFNAPIVGAYDSWWICAGCYHFDLPLDVKKGIIRLVKYDLPIFQWVQ